MINKDYEWWDVRQDQGKRIVIAHNCKLDDGERVTTLGALTFPIDAADEIIEGIRQGCEEAKLVNETD